MPGIKPKTSHMLEHSHYPWARLQPTIPFQKLDSFFSPYTKISSRWLKKNSGMKSLSNQYLSEHNNAQVSWENGLTYLYTPSPQLTMVFLMTSQLCDGMKAYTFCFSLSVLCLINCRKYLVLYYRRAFTIDDFLQMLANVSVL